MKTLAALLAIAALASAATPASAKGCLKGAVVGGVAGHYAGHHGVLGAIAGCAYGRHRANEQDARGAGPGARRPRARSCNSSSSSWRTHGPCPGRCRAEAVTSTGVW